MTLTIHWCQEEDWFTCMREQIVAKLTREHRMSADHLSIGCMAKDHGYQSTALKCSKESITFDRKRNISNHNNVMLKISSVN